MWLIKLNRAYLGVSYVTYLLPLPICLLIGYKALVFNILHYSS